MTDLNSGRARIKKNLGFAAAIALVFALAVGALVYLAFGRVLFPSIYLAVVLAVVCYSLNRNLTGRRRWRVRFAVAGLLEITLVVAAFVYLTMPFEQTFGKAPDAGMIVGIGLPLLLAVLLIQGVFTAVYYRINPVARFDDQIFSTMGALWGSSDKVRRKVETLRQKRAVLLRDYLAKRLNEAERVPALPASQRLFSWLIDDLTEVEKLPPSTEITLGRAFLGMARGLSAHGDPTAPVLFGRALRYPLPPESRKYLAPYLASKRDRSSVAIQAYGAYVQANNNQAIDPANPIYVIAQELCEVDRSDSPERLSAVEATASLMFKADARLGWAALSLGKCLLWQNKPGEALACFEKAFALLPGDAEPLLYAGQAQAALNRPDAALTAYRRAVQARPDDLECQFYLGQALVAGGRAEQIPEAQRSVAAEAQRYLNAVVAAQPDYGEAHDALALSYLAISDYATARKHAEKAIKVGLATADTYYHYAQASAGLADYAVAVAAAEKAVELAPGHPGALLLLGRELLRAGCWSEAQAIYETVLAASPQQPEAVGGLGQALFGLEDYAQAIELLSSLAAPTRDDLYALGRAYVHYSAFPEGAETLRRALSTFEADADLYYALGCACAQMGELPNALDAFEHSLALKVTANVHLQRGHVFMRLGKFEPALEAYWAALCIAPEAAEAHYALGLYQYRCGDLHTAKSAFEQAAWIAPDSGLAHLGQGAVLESLGDLTGATQAYERALACNAPSSQVMLRLGVLANKLSRFEQAIGPLTQACQAKVKSPEALYHLGFAHAQLGNWTGALDAWGILLDRVPDDEALQLDVARCRYQLGYQRLDACDFGGAIEAWEKALTVFRQDKTLRESLAEAYFRHGVTILGQSSRTGYSVKDGLAAFERARELGLRDDWRLYFFEALGALAGNDTRTAIDILHRLGNTTPIGSRIAYHLGYAMQQNGEPDQVRPYLEEALQSELPPHLRVGASLMLAGLHASQSDWEQTAAVYRDIWEM